MGGSGSDLLWARALAVAESMEARDSTLEDIGGFLCGLDEVFSVTADPVEDFPAYVAGRVLSNTALTSRLYALRIAVDESHGDRPGSLPVHTHSAYKGALPMYSTVANWSDTQG
jgi:hypothetical protein